jgi:hypothetical protein
VTNEAEAKAHEIPITLQVVNERGAPIPTASIRHPKEAMLHTVNHVTARWTADALNLLDGTRVPFTNKQMLTLEITAPGYQSAHITFQIRKRKNVMTVVLPFMSSEADSEKEDDPIVQFRRSKPIE